MTSICLSTSFVSLLRRLFNALSVFSISQHYVMAKKATVAFNADGVPQPVQEGPKSLSAGPGEDVGCGGVDGWVFEVVEVVYGSNYKISIGSV